MSATSRILCAATAIILPWCCGAAATKSATSSARTAWRSCANLLAIFHREDPTRPVTAACDQIAAEPKAAPPEFLNLLDVVGYNYVDRWRERRELYYSIDKAAHPNWRMIGTESCGMGGPRGDYRGLVPPRRAKRRAANPRAAGGFLRGFGMRFAGSTPRNCGKFVRTHDYVAGDFMWTGIDYLGESRGGRAWRSRRCHR